MIKVRAGQTLQKGEFTCDYCAHFLVNYFSIPDGTIMCLDCREKIRKENYQTNFRHYCREAKRNNGEWQYCEGCNGKFLCYTE